MGTMTYRELAKEMIEMSKKINELEKSLNEKIDKI